MKPFYLMGEYTMSMLFLFGSLAPLQAQDKVSYVDIKDSVVSEISPIAKSEEHNHSIQLSSVLVPAMLTGTSALFVNSSWFVKQRDNIQDALSSKGKRYTEIDNYLQYSPIVAVYGLNLAGVRGKHNFVDRTGILAISYATMGILVNGMKYTIKEKRPDSNARNSFPSGHTATAFMGAEFMRQEYKDASPWIAYSGYAVAIATGYLRIYNDRHYLNDVVAGACIGYVSTRFGYWLYPKIFKKSKCGKNETSFYSLPFYSDGKVGINISATF